jgi:ubiquinone/menaquinone biosynthesis C-methylase UbiE
MILDFGCGDGRIVDEYRSAGLQAFGADVILPKKGPYLRLIPTDNYRLPFDDDTFDFVYSNSVLEHVRDLDSALLEVRRVLKPGGASLHLFPPKSTPIEPHVFVPLAGLIRSRPWLLFWAALGIRSSFQQDLGWRETAQDNYIYLHNHTFYRTRRELRGQILGKFCNLVFADREMIEHSYGKARHIAPLVRLMPVVASIYGAMHNRCVYFEKRREPG